MAFSNVARYSEPGRFFWATQNVAPAWPNVSRPADVHRGVAAVEVDHQDAAALVGEVGEAFRFVGGRREGLLAEHVDVASQAGLDGVRVFRAGGQHEDRVQVLGVEHVLDGSVGGAETPAPHQRSGVRAAGHEGREFHVVALDQGRQLGDGGDVPAPMTPTRVRACAFIGRSPRWPAGSRRARSAAADRAKPIAGSGRSCGCQRYSYSRVRTSS